MRLATDGQLSPDPALHCIGMMVGAFPRVGRLGHHWSPSPTLSRGGFVP